MRFLVIALLVAAPAQALFRHPAVSRTHVAFVHAGQVWVVPRGGGAATPVTDTAGPKGDVRFSPDGTEIAFSSMSVYIVPVQRGAAARRVTWLPREQVLTQWTNDDRLLFYTNAQSFSRVEMQLFTTTPGGALAVKLPPEYGADGALDDSGTWLAYTREWPNHLIRYWKHYRGGSAPDITLLNLRTGESAKITDSPLPDVRPMWHGQRLYYLCDGDVCSYDIRTRVRKQLTRGMDITGASIGPDAIALESGGGLQLFDLRTAKVTPLRIRVPRPEKLEREVDASKFVTHRDRALVEARGDLWIEGKNVTRTSGAFEREASLSPDGRWVVYSRSGALASSPRSPARSEDAPCSAGGTPALRCDELLLLDLVENRTTTIATFASGFRYRPVWSPDSKRIAFVDQRGAVLVSDLRAVQEIDRDAWAELPELAWSPDSTWLAYTKTAPNRLGTIWRWDGATRQQLTADVFNASTPSFDAGHLYFLSYRNFANPVTDWLSQRFLHRDLSIRMAVPLKGIAFDVDSIERSAFRAPEKETKKEELPPLPAMPVRIDLRAEWRQIFDDVVRGYRDFFHAPVAPRVDWQAMHRKYLPLLEQCETREEVNVVLSMLIGESQTGHAYVANPGDVAPVPPNTTGMLGADFVLENGAFRIARIYEGAPWDDLVRSPLRGVREGEVLAAVNGVPLDVTRDPRAAFVGLADKSVTITVGTRDLVVTPVADEVPLRYRDWVERNRRRVDAESQGRVGYVHIPEFTTSGLNDFARQYYGQIDREALIVDARWSQGGWTGGHLAELLARTHLNSAATRESEHAWPVPRWGAHFGRKALLVNHITISAGENFAFYFRKLGLGPIVGTRTWGGLTGLNPVPALIDGGAVNVPNAPFFDGSGWLIEGHGLEPDVVEERDPIGAALLSVF